MRPSEIQRVFRDCGAWQEGHFVLSSGLHSNQYFQCAALLQHPTLASRVCQVLAQRFLTDELTCVAAPALGGIIVGYELARHLGIRSIFAERVDGKLAFRRSFQVMQQDRVLVVEDVITTGGSVDELINMVKESGATVVGVGTLVDRSGGWVAFEQKFHALMSLNLKTYAAAECPLCREGVPVIKPGSRGLSPETPR